MDTRQLVESYDEIGREMDQMYELEYYELPDIIHAMLYDGRAELSYVKPGSEREGGVEMWFPKLTKGNEDYCYQLTWYPPSKHDTWPYAGMNYDLEKFFLETGELDNESLEDHGFNIEDQSTHGDAIEAWYKSTLDDEMHKGYGDE